MKAAVYEKYGGPDVVHIKDVKKPSPANDEVLIKIYASTVNRTDCGFLRGKPRIVRFFSGLAKPKYTILGDEFSGKIEAFGSDVKSFSVGDKVFGYQGVTFGGHAEYITVKEDSMIAKMPDGFSYAEGAAMTEGAHYALSFIRAAKMAPGQKILVNGGTGGIGSAAVQLISNLGADVTATCRTEHIKTVKSLGASKVIDYTKEDFTELDEQFDAVFDAVGKSSFKRCKSVLKPKGIYLSSELGPWIQNPFMAMITPLFGGRKVMFPIPKDLKSDIEFLADEAIAGRFKPMIDRHFDLEDISQAYEYVELGQKAGNVIIDIAKS